MAWHLLQPKLNTTKLSLFQGKNPIVCGESSLLIILIFLLLSYLPHLFWQPLWVSLFFLALWSYRLLVIGLNCPRPSRIVLFCLSLLIFFGIFVSWGMPIGQEPGSALLALMLGIKTFEIKSYRDSMVSLFLGLFLLFSTVLFSQSLGIGLYLIILLWVFLLSLMSLHQSKFQLKQIIGQSSLILSHGLPLAIVCFLFFPRLPGSLIGLKDIASQGITGLSDHISPGSISRLILSSDVAFRVSFDDYRPKPKEMYWRVLVFRDFDGWAWTPGKLHRSKLSPSICLQDKLVSYSITLEPTFNRRLVSLDIPISIPEGAELRPGFILRTKEKIKTRVQYDLTSSINYKICSPGKVQNDRALKENPVGNPKTQSLTEKIYDNSNSAKEYLANILDYLEENNFVYSLTPLKLRPKDPIDDFLFRTKEGYCEHYAQALAWMLRDQNIPARLVAGYQGGQLNDLGDYFIIRDSDAHVWVEACLQDQGWIRIDPTNVLAPERIEQGIQAVAPKVNSPSLLRIQGLGWLSDMSQGLGLGIDAINYNWQKWVVDYTFSKQSQLFKYLNLGDSAWQALSKTILLTLLILFILLALIATILFRPFRRRTDLVLKWYYKYIRKLHKSGLSFARYEGPLDLSKKVKKELPDQQEEVENLTDLYIRLRYSSAPKSRQDLISFKKAVKAFSPK